MHHNPVNWFELPVKDLSTAQAFYEAVLGFTLEELPSPSPELKMLAFPMEWGKPGAAGALVESEHYTPGGNGVILYFTVTDIEATLAAAEAAGGKIMVPKKDIGEYGWIGWFIDPDGNYIGVHTAKPMVDTPQE